jgi:hypothetical protein
VALAWQSCLIPELDAQENGATDIGWPRQVQNNNGTLVYYQPQVDEWKNYKELMAEWLFR